MYKPIDPFLVILPQLDVHGYTRDTVMTVVNDFIKDNFKLGKKKILIIHGTGENILKNVIHDGLKKNKLVDKFYLYNFNLGCTIVELSENGHRIDLGTQEISREETLNLKEDMEILSISNIEIEKIFGRFSYYIDFNENNVYVIHAPNGCGKSSLLKYINLFLNQKLRELDGGVFKRINIKCTDTNNRNYYYDFSPLAPMNNNNKMQLSLLPNCTLIKDLYSFNIKDKVLDKKYFDIEMNDRIDTFNSIMKDFFCYEKKVGFLNQINFDEKLRIYIKYDDIDAINVPNLFKPGHLMSFEELSSGEQFIIKLFYSLIFRLKRNGFVLLDEPEISLHVEWQELLIKNIVKIANLYNIKVLIATHSPYLLNNPDVKVGNAIYEN